MDPRLAHFMDPLVETRTLLQGKVPPNVLKSTIARDLLSVSDEPGNVVGIDVVALIVGNGVSW